MKLFRNNQGTFIKVLSLTIGLTVGLVLIAKVQLESNYDSCIIDKEHVYELSEVFKSEGEAQSMEYSATAGGVIPALCQHIPEIEVGTRGTSIKYDDKIQLENGMRYLTKTSLLADSCFFDIFHTTILQGDAKQILCTAGQCLVSQRLAERMGGDVIGKTFCFLSSPTKRLTICGVFQEYAENNSFWSTDVIISMSSIGMFIWDGSQNLIGNDRYFSVVRLRQDADVKKVREQSDAMFLKILPWDELKESGLDEFHINFNPISESRMKDNTVRTTCLILLLVAIVMLFTAVMNYILVVISSLVGRARLMAVRKVLGAPTWEFYWTTLREASFHLLLALCIMTLLLWAGQDWIRDLMGISVRTLFSTQTYLVLVLVCLAVILCCGLLPGFIYSRIPVTYAYRLFSESKRVWKLSLLAFQFVLSTMLLCILTTIYRQYDFMLNKDLGYEYDNLAYISINVPSDSTFTLAREIEKLSCVESTATTYSLPIFKTAGNNIMLPNDPRQLFNYACLYYAESNILHTLGIQLIQGKGFTPLEHYGTLPEAIVNESFANKLKEFTGWDDVVGRDIVSTEFDDTPFTIVGVVKDFTIGNLVHCYTRPAMLFNGNRMAYNIAIRFHQISADNIQAVQQLCDRLYPDADMTVRPYSAELKTRYDDTQHTRDLILIGCLASLLITLVGLIGYIRDEVQRRSRELAIRKVMGATVFELQTLFLRNLLLIALPTIVCGIILGIYCSLLMLEQFAEQIVLHGWEFALIALSIAAVITAVAFFQTRRIAMHNPMENFRAE